MAHLKAFKLSEEIGLILDRVRRCTKPYLAIFLNSSGVMTSCGLVVQMTHPLVESTELDQAIAHDIWIWRIASLYLVDGICNDIVPIVFLQVNDIVFKAITMGHSLDYLKVFFLWA